MIKQKLTILAATIAVAASIATSQAALVTGAIGFSGHTIFNNDVNTQIQNATSVTSWINAKVDGQAGSFAGIADNTPVTFATPWSFNSGAVSPFWQVGGFTFNLISSSVFVQGPNGVIVTGVGTVTGNGYTQTTMDWFFSSQGGVASFSASSSTIPEPSTVVAGALLLLPFGISTVRILRKNKNA